MTLIWVIWTIMKEYLRSSQSVSTVNLFGTLKNNVVFLQSKRGVNLLTSRLSAGSAAFIIVWYGLLLAHVPILKYSIRFWGSTNERVFVCVCVCVCVCVIEGVAFQVHLLVHLIFFHEKSYEIRIISEQTNTIIFHFLFTDFNNMAYARSREWGVTLAPLNLSSWNDLCQ